jgi:hypothetical protein
MKRRRTSVIAILAVGSGVFCDCAPTLTPAGSRTSDASGFVDNGGRFLEERARTEMSGVRVTELGAERTTGTPGSGWPLPIEATGKPRRPERASPATPILGQIAGQSASTVVERIASAQCDLEESCEHIGEGKAWPTHASCMAEIRERIRSEAEEAQCAEGFDTTAVGNCVATIRTASCQPPSKEAPTRRSECELAASCFGT